MNGKIAAGFIVLTAAIAGIAIYYLQVYAYYDRVPASAPAAEIVLAPLSGDPPETIVADNFEGIDADSSPLRFRACFTTPLSLAMLTETYRVYDNAVPLTGPGWFGCYDAAAIGEALERGEAIAFLSVPEIARGVDRVVAVFPDGRAYAWHQLNGTLE